VPLRYLSNENTGSRSRQCKWLSVVLSDIDPLREENIGNYVTGGPGGVGQGRHVLARSSTLGSCPKG